MKKVKIADRIKILVRFFSHDIWVGDFEHLSNIRKKMITFLKWSYLVVNGFVKDQCLLRASALTYTLVLSIIPLLAVAFSGLKGFGFQDMDVIRNLIYKITLGQKKVADTFLVFLDNTNVTTLGIIGSSFLLITVISLLGNIEKSFNVIWGVKKTRSIGRKFTDYLSVTLVSPFLFIVAISATATLQSTSFVQTLLQISVLAKLYIFLLSLVPYFIICLVLTFLYSFMPNTKVKIIPALIGGLVAGVLWQLSQWAILKFQLFIVKYNAIYGVFAQIPLFLIWIYISWIIILLGTEISFAVQNYKTYSREAVALRLSTDAKQRLAVRLLIELTRNFESEDTLLSNEQLAEKLRIPVKLVNELLYMLEIEKVTIKIDREDGEFYTLIRPPRMLTIGRIIKYLNKYKEVDINLQSDKELNLINSIFNDIDQTIEKSQAKISLLDIVNKLKRS